MNRTENVRIQSTTLGYEDHGILTADISLTGSGWSCGFGGYALDSWNETQKRRIGTDYGMEFVSQVLKTVGVSNWEELIGKYVRIETEGWGGRILRIGHIVENKWFDPKELADRMGKE